MKIHYFICFLFSSIGCLAQNGTEHFYELDFEVGKKYYTFAQDLNVREAPDKNSEKVAELSIGIEVTLLEIDPEIITISGFTSNWLKVKVDHKIEGYIPGTYVANGRISTGEPDEYLLYKRRISDSSSKIFFRLAQTRYYFLDLGSFDLANNSFSVSFFDNKGLSGIDHVIELNFLAEACGEEGGTRYFILNKEKESLLSLGLFNSTGDGGIYHIHEYLIFPNDPEGLRDTIIYIGETGEELEDENTYRTVSLRKRYMWNNGALENPIEKFDYR